MLPLPVHSQDEWLRLGLGMSLGIKRVVRYLQGNPVAKITYEAQEVDAVLRGFSDSDWAGDPHSRRSTSGGVLFRGRHAVHWWSQLPARVALSSCEAEVNALVEATSECLHVQRLGHAFGDSMRITLFTDASAAKGVVMRSGAGKLKHLSVKQFLVAGVRFSR